MSSLSNSSSVDHMGKGDDVEELEALLDAFGSMFSIEDISSAYWEANKDLALTGELLLGRLQNDNNPFDEVETVASAPVEHEYKLGTSMPTLSERSDYTLASLNGFKRGKKLTVSTGLVPGVIGKDYARIEQPARPLKATKPVKVDLSEFLTSTVDEENESEDHGVNKMHQEVEDFLFQMLGHGFQFDMDCIREVLGQCGYDMKKGMEKLLDLSVTTLEKSDDIIGGSASNPNLSREIDMEYSLAQESHRNRFSSSPANRTNTTGRKNDVSGIEREVLEALFTAPGLHDEKPEYCQLSRRKLKSRSGALGNAVVARPEIVNHFRTTVTMEPKITNGDTEDGENSYEVLRQAVKEYWVLMKEYYKAAFEAFSNGDLVKANKLLDKGHFFNEKAKDADGKSAEMLFRARDEVMSLDLRDYKPSGAIRLIRSHLTTLAGISSIEYLKLRIGTEAEDKKRARRKRVLQELEAESIKWTEDQNGEIISIRVGEINPQELSFVKAK